MGKISEMNDREWRKAVEDQRHVVDELEEREEKQAKLLKATKTEVKSEKNKLACILRGEDPDDTFVDGDKDPVLPFEGDGSHDVDDDEQDGKVGVETKSTSARKPGKAKGPRSTT